jgi:Cu-Zn family superoxide dismutase
MTRVSSALAVVSLLVSACGASTVNVPADASVAPVAAGVAEVAPTEGNVVSGTLYFGPAEGGVRVWGTLTGFGGAGEHGFHVHENGDCSAPDATSAGGHFNPTAADHGAPGADHSIHVGDMGNIVADETGTAVVDMVLANLSLEGETSVLGRGVIVHANADDFTTQPTGNSGPRIGCGVISAVAAP